MAAIAETSFAALLSADSAVALPDTDKEVAAMLNDYGATFVKRKNAAADRLDLLAGRSRRSLFQRSPVGGFGGSTP
jgi:hypothetical protein